MVRRPQRIDPRRLTCNGSESILPGLHGLESIQISGANCLNIGKPRAISRWRTADGEQPSRLFWTVAVSAAVNRGRERPANEREPSETGGTPIFQHSRDGYVPIAWCGLKLPLEQVICEFPQASGLGSKWRERAHRQLGETGGFAARGWQSDDRRIGRFGHRLVFACGFA